MDVACDTLSRSDNFSSALQGTFDESVGNIKSRNQVLVMQTRRVRYEDQGQQEIEGLAQPLRRDCVHTLNNSTRNLICIAA